MSCGIWFAISFSFSLSRVVTSTDSYNFEGFYDYLWMITVGWSVQFDFTSPHPYTLSLHMPIRYLYNYNTVNIQE